jgi:hypothetical protein
MEKVFSLRLRESQNISSFVVMPEPAEFTDNTLLDKYGYPYKFASVCPNVQATETLIEFIKQKMSSHYFELDRIEDGKCHKYPEHGYMRPHKDRQVSDDHIFTMVIVAQDEHHRSGGLYINGNYTCDNTVYLFHPHVEHEVRRVRQERISYTFKVFGKMNWYQYFLSIQKYVPSKYPNFVEQMITEFQEGKNEYNDYEYDAHRIADLKAIIMYSGDYNDSIWEIRKLNNYEWPEHDKKLGMGSILLNSLFPVKSTTWSFKMIPNRISLACPKSVAMSRVLQLRK